MTRTSLLAALTIALFFLIPQVNAQQPVFSMVGSAAQPGQTVMIPLVMHSSGTQVCAVSADVTYDASALTWVSGQTGPAGSAAGKNAVVQPIGPGVIRVALIGMNTNPVMDGSILEFVFTVNSAASGNTSIRVNCGAADCMGSDYPMIATGVTLNLGQGTEEPQEEPEDGSTGGEPATGTEEPNQGNPDGSSQGSSTSSHGTSETGTLTETETTEETEEAEPKKVPMKARVLLSPRKGLAPLTVNLRTKVSGGTPPFTFTWDYGIEQDIEQDVKSSEEEAEVETYDEADIRFIYEAVGEFIPKVTVEDADGDTVTAEAKTNIRVMEPPAPELLSASYTVVGDDATFEMKGRKFRKGDKVEINGLLYCTEDTSHDFIQVVGVPAPTEVPVRVKVVGVTGRKSVMVHAMVIRKEAPADTGSTK